MQHFQVPSAIWQVTLFVRVPDSGDLKREEDMFLCEVGKGSCNMEEMDSDQMLISDRLYLFT